MNAPAVDVERTSWAGRLMADFGANRVGGNGR